jgi:dolichyl-phosphate-mannose--protein O-mannosyl transferase
MQVLVLVVGIVCVFAEVVSEAVTFGSSVKMHSLHEKEKYYLFSENMHWNMQGVQGLQVVTAARERADHRLYWTVLPPNDAASKVSKPVACGSDIILVHSATSKNLFSRRERGIISGQQFVTTQGSMNAVDPGDIFKVECVTSTPNWTRESPVKFRHVQTGKYLKTSGRFVYHNGNCPNCSINGDREISTGEPSASEDRWAASDGVFFNGAIVKEEATTSSDIDRDEL